MWLPLLLKQYNEAEMQSMGLKLTAEDLYSANKSSLKDAVVHFGGGCTGELISDQSLILTNHHCGFSYVQSHSSTTNDLITKGFWAMSQKEELPNPGLTVTFIVRMEDVTKQVLDGLKGSDKQKEKSIKDITDAIIKKATEGTHYEGLIKPFFYGNQYYMYITETFKDVRLVGAPPKSIGNFGGDTDNWMWPRHTGDFSLFRIYAGKDNKPADYSPENVPYKPKHYFPVSLKGIEKNDFTLVYGFPGRTTEYLISDAVDLVMNHSDPVKVKIREAKLNVWNERMKVSDEIRIKYAAKKEGVSNAYKKWIGEMNGLKKYDAVNRKIKFESEFTDAVLGNDSLRQYKDVISKLKGYYAEWRPLYVNRDYLNEAFFGIELMNSASNWTEVATALEKNDMEGIKKHQEKMRKNLELGAFKNFDLATDKLLFVQLFPIFYNNISDNLKPPFAAEMQKRFGADYSKWAELLYSSSFLTSEDKFKLAVEKMNKKQILNDPFIKMVREVDAKFNVLVNPKFFELNDKITEAYKEYIAALFKVFPQKKFYPDANSTLRVAYGKVDDYDPRDGVHYKHFTTLDGIIEKERSGEVDFIIPQKLKQLQATKDYGKYADKDGTVHVAFTASNHTTGGNSGSPVINGEGQLIGTNFDRNWEGTMSDVMYDPSQVRNITLDVRYTLFIIDKFAGAGYLLNEMKLVY